jgi:hypothetical protein
MAGNSAFASDFDQTEWETTIRETMRMGMPEADEQKLTWWWKRERTYAPDDTAGNPYDWTDDPVTDDPGNTVLPDTGEEQSLIVDYALEFSSRPAGSVITVLGEIDNSRAIVTLLDVDYQQIKTADYATIEDTTYRIQFTSPSLGLFASTVWQVVLEAVDEA